VYAVTITEPGGPDVLKWTEVPDPEPGPGEVLIDIHSSAVNRADILQRQGGYQPPPGAPPYPGLECAGRITARGPDTAGPAESETRQVCALLGGGGYAQKVAVPAGQVLPVPTGLSLDQAGGLPEVACTVWSNVIDIAALQPGETILVHGGGSGIGTFTIQLAKAIGARVVTTARRSKHEALRQLGADVTIDYTEEDFAEATKRATGGRGADVILDIVGAKYLPRNVDALAVNGRLVVIGMQGGRKGELDLGALMAKRALVAATTLRARPPDDKARIVAGVHRDVWPLVESGAIRIVIDRRLSMDRAAEAHRIVEASEHIGKVVLVNPAA
jgi:putative PIG3 family NAD(P)H quinone oxidoreductase